VSHKGILTRPISQEIKPINKRDIIKPEEPPIKPKESDEIKQKNEGYQVLFEAQRIDQKGENVHINISFLVNEINTLIEDVYLTSENGFKKDKHCITKMDCNEFEKDYLLPRSHTCFFTLDLPNYSTYEILEEKLMYAMKNGIVISDNDDEAIDIEL
jgi:hypothetical protein